MHGRCYYNTLPVSACLTAQEVSAEDFDPDRDVLFDIPVDENTAEMTCAVVEMPDSTDTDRLYDDTKSLYEKFDPTKVSYSLPVNLQPVLCYKPVLSVFHSPQPLIRPAVINDISCTCTQ